MIQQLPAFKSTSWKKFLFFSYAFTLSFLGYSKNIYVNDASTVGDVWCTASSGSLGTIASPYFTLNTALTNAVSGDIIYVDAGNYTEKSLLAKSGVTVIGAGAYKTNFIGSGASGVWFMKIDGITNFSIANITASKYSNSVAIIGQIFTITNSSNIKINNVLLAKNDGSSGDAAIYIGTGSSNIILDSISGSCQNTSSSGTAILISGKEISVFIKNSLFSGNDNSAQGSNASAVRLIADIGSTPNVILNIENSVFSENTAKKGGAIYIEGGSVTINKCKFLGNKTTNTSGNDGGGALWIAKTNSLCTISNSEFKGNVSAADGGAIQVYTGVGAADVKIENCLFENNSAVNGNDIHTRMKSGKKFSVTVNNCQFNSVLSTKYNVTSGPSPIAPCEDGDLKITNSGTPKIYENVVAGYNCISKINIDNLPSGYVDPAITFPSYQGCPNAAICNPAIPGTTPTIICPTSSTSTVTLTVTGPSNSKFTWYDVPTGGTAKGTSTSASPNFVAQIPNLASGSKTLYVVSDLDNCQIRVPITVTCSTCTPPTPSFTSSATSACPNAKVKYATSAGKSTYVWTISGISGTDYTIVSGGTTTSDTLIIEWLTKGDKVVKVGFTENSCASTTPASITTKVSDVSTGVFIAQPSTNSCQNAPIIYAADKNYTNFNWQITGVLGTDYEIVAGGKTTDDTLIVKWKTLGNHTVKLDYTAGVGGCVTTTSASNIIQVVANPSTLSFSSSDVKQPTCKDAMGSVKINLPYAGVWNIEAKELTTSSISDTNTKVTIVPFSVTFNKLNQGSYTFQIIDINGCVSPVSSAITIDPQPISPAKPVLDVNTIYCASDSYNTFSLDKIVFNPKPNSTETVKYLNENNNTIPGQTIVDSTKKYKFLFDNGVCSSKDTLVTKISFDKGPSNVPLVDISSTLICAIEKPDFNLLFTKIPTSITSGFTFLISKNPSGNPIIPNTTYLPTNGGLLDSIYYTRANKYGCKNVTFGKLKFINNVGPTGLSLNGKQLFCGFSNPTVAKLDTSIVSKTNAANSLVWYSSETAVTPLPRNTSLVDGFYFAAEKPTTGCESFVRKKIEAIIQVFGPTILEPANIYTFCKGSNKTIADLPNSPYTSANLVWLDANKKAITDKTMPLVQGTYYAAEFKNSCVSNNSQAIDVKFESSPILKLLQLDTIVCPGGNINFKTELTPAVTSPIYQWTVNGAKVGSNSSIYWSNALKSNDKITVNVTSKDFCPSTANLYVRMDSLRLSMQLPSMLYVKAPAINLVGYPVGGIFSGKGITTNKLDPSVVGVGSKLVTYSFKNANNCSGQITQKVLVYDTVLNNCHVTTYDTVKVSDTVSVLKVKFKLTTGIKANQETTMRVYPNPTSDILRIEVADEKAMAGYTYKIIDAAGKVVYNQQVKAAVTEISLKTLGAVGAYFLEVLDENFKIVVSKKIILE